jgi:hypothetical protein
MITYSMPDKEKVMLLRLSSPLKGREFEKKYSAVNSKNLSFSFCLALEINALILAIMKNCHFIARSCSLPHGIDVSN